MNTDTPVIKRKLELDELGRKVAKVVNELMPEFCGSVSFNIKKGFFCNWETNERGQEQKR